MIILNPKKSNTNFKIILENYKNTLNFGSLTCPYCSSQRLIKHGSYKRNLFYIDNKQISHEIVTIQRMLCKDCHHTHALIPSFIIPYRQHTLDIILYSLMNFPKYDPVTININFDTILYWKKDFYKCHSYFNNIIPRGKDIIKTILSDIFYYYKQFYIINKKIFMMVHKGILNMAYL